jgi:hypothetical protein
VLDNIKFNVADSREAVGDFVEQFVGNSTRLAELRRELQECHLWRVIVIQVKVLDQTLLGRNYLNP